MRPETAEKIDACARRLREAIKTSVAANESADAAKAAAFCAQQDVERARVDLENACGELLNEVVNE